MEVLRLEPGEGEVIRHHETRELRIVADREAATVTWSRYAPGERGPDPHVHHRHTDAFVVLVGELVFELDGEDVRAAAGTFVAAPPGLVHTFRNAGPGEARFLNVHAPHGGFAEVLRAARDSREPREPFDSVDAGPGSGRPGADGRDVVGIEIGGALALVVPR